MMTKRYHKYYQLGFEKGVDDARRGLSVKLLSHWSELCHDLLRIWEVGYLDGYQSIRADINIKRKAC